MSFVSKLKKKKKKKKKKKSTHSNKKMHMSQSFWLVMINTCTKPVFHKPFWLDVGIFCPSNVYSNKWLD